jgi:hypothetical protein
MEKSAMAWIEGYLTVLVHLSTMLWNVYGIVHVANLTGMRIEHELLTAVSLYDDGSPPSAVFS